MLTVEEQPVLQAETLQPAFSPHLIESKPYELVQASSGKRFANYLIDLLSFYMLMIFWGVLLALASPETIDNMDDSTWDGLGGRILSMIAFGVFMGFIEGVFGGRSLGKLITGTKAVNEADGQDISFGTAFSRGFCRIVPFEAFSGFGSPCYPWHDKWTDTVVIDIKQTEQANQLRTI